MKRQHGARGEIGTAGAACVGRRAMVSQGDAQATSELETVLARVPPEMWVAIARAGPGEMAFAMERVCQSWRCALVAAGEGSPGRGERGG